MESQTDKICDGLAYHRLELAKHWLGLGTSTLASGINAVSCVSGLKTSRRPLGRKEEVSNLFMDSNIEAERLNPFSFKNVTRFELRAQRNELYFEITYYAAEMWMRDDVKHTRQEQEG
jgi:hypothetical protein